MSYTKSAGRKNAVGRKERIRAGNGKQAQAAGQQATARADLLRRFREKLSAAVSPSKETA